MKQKIKTQMRCLISAEYANAYYLASCSLMHKGYFNAQ